MEEEVRKESGEKWDESFRFKKIYGFGNTRAFVFLWTNWNIQEKEESVHHSLTQKYNIVPRLLSTIIVPVWFLRRFLYVFCGNRGEPSYRLFCWTNSFVRFLINLMCALVCSHIISLWLIPGAIFLWSNTSFYPSHHETRLPLIKTLRHILIILVCNWCQQFHIYGRSTNVLEYKVPEVLFGLSCL